ncbi:hypothetical protein LV75_002079 [Actinokineospora diospyrosa]|uniref:Uncharacterized protein n=1 Tax=Actinokineospora diospyrosa TaxID=103728 RepID=A0ABT1IAB6_9PSEU|nr:hypothetical protein [Actinokineospora diospyrosa]
MHSLSTRADRTGAANGTLWTTETVVDNQASHGNGNPQGKIN